MKKVKQTSKPDADFTSMVDNVIKKVLIAERQKQHLRNPKGIIEDIQRIIEKEIDKS